MVKPKSSVFPKDMHENLESVFISVNLWLKDIISHRLTRISLIWCIPAQIHEACIYDTYHKSPIFWIVPRLPLNLKRIVFFGLSALNQKNAKDAIGAKVGNHIIHQNQKHTTHLYALLSSCANLVVSPQLNNTKKPVTFYHPL